MQINATISGSWVSLQSPYSKSLIEIYKMFPGSKWDPTTKTWKVALNAWDTLKSALSEHKISEYTVPRQQVVPIEAMMAKLRPYQQTGVVKLLENDGYLLNLSMRLGKSVSAITAACSALSAKVADTVLVLYPASARGTWNRELKKWANVELVNLRGETELDQPTANLWRLLPFTFFGCHYEILKEQESSIAKLLSGRKYIIIADELHLIKNPKAGRTKTAARLARGKIQLTAPSDSASMSSATFASATPVARWGLSGTPMRNRPADLWAVFDFLQPDSMGSFGKFCERYTGAVIADFGHHYEKQVVIADDGTKTIESVVMPGHWDTKGSSNEEELAARLSAISLRVTREQAAPWLPKCQRRVINCQVPEKELKKYRKLESALGQHIDLNNIESPSAQARDAIRDLAFATSQAKIPTVVARLQEHFESGYKVAVFAHFHESLDKLQETLNKNVDPNAPHVFFAPGYHLPKRRDETIETWKAAPKPTAILLNSIASGVAIDLSQADVALFLEPEWVPADFMQVQARLLDVHLGTRTAPPLYEFFVVQNTIDENMLKVLLQKTKTIEAIVGKDQDTQDLGAIIRDSGILGDNVGLANSDRDTIQAAILSLRDRLMASPETDTETPDQDTTISDFESSWDHMEDTDDEV